MHLSFGHCAFSSKDDAAFGRKDYAVGLFGFVKNFLTEFIIAAFCESYHGVAVKQ